MEPFVIAVAGPSGSGKTTLVNELARRLGDASTLYYDDYPKEFLYGGTLEGWLKDGGDPNVWRTSRLIEDLVALRSGRNIDAPKERGRVRSTEFIVVEEPFGRSRAEFAAVSDFSICLDIPMSVALARRLLRDIPVYLSRSGPEGLEEYLRQHLNWYSNGGWLLYPTVNEHAKGVADCVLDGMFNPDALAAAGHSAVLANISKT